MIEISLCYAIFRAYVIPFHHKDSESLKLLFLLITPRQFFHLYIAMEIAAEIYKIIIRYPISSSSQRSYKHSIDLYKNWLNDFEVNLD